MATCHTDRIHYCKGLCESCYVSLAAKRRRKNKKYREQANEKARKWCLHNAQKARDYDTRKHLRKAFGITVQEYADICSRQNGLCALCRNPETIKNKRDGSLQRLSIDHCHATGRIRGALCRACNMMLSRFEKNPEIYYTIHAYLGPDFVGENLKTCE
jgi:hypothetical protein